MAKLGAASTTQPPYETYDWRTAQALANPTAAPNTAGGMAARIEDRRRRLCDLRLVAAPYALDPAGVTVLNPGDDVPALLVANGPIDR